MNTQEYFGFLFALGGLVFWSAFGIGYSGWIVGLALGFAGLILGGIAGWNLAGLMNWHDSERVRAMLWIARVCCKWLVVATFILAVIGVLFGPPLVLEVMRRLV